MHRMVLVAALALVPANAFADWIQPFGVSGMTWNRDIAFEIPKFDLSLGILTSVSFSAATNEGPTMNYTGPPTTPANPFVSWEGVVRLDTFGSDLPVLVHGEKNFQGMGVVSANTSTGPIPSTEWVNVSKAFTTGLDPFMGEGTWTLQLHGSWVIYEYHPPGATFLMGQIYRDLWVNVEYEYEPIPLVSSLIMASIPNPEPSVLALVGVALGGMWWWKRRRTAGKTISHG